MHVRLLRLERTTLGYLLRKHSVPLKVNWTPACTLFGYRALTGARRTVEPSKVHTRLKGGSEALSILSLNLANDGRAR